MMKKDFAIAIWVCISIGSMFFFWLVVALWSDYLHCVVLKSVNGYLKVWYSSSLRFKMYDLPHLFSFVKDDFESSVLKFVKI